MSEQQDEKYPLELSLKGSNTIYVGCEFRSCRQNYAICLNIIKAVKEKRRKPEEECCSEIKRGICPALKMRKEEVEAGYALYYKPRAPAPVIEKKGNTSFFSNSNFSKSDPSYQRGWNHAGSVIRGDKKDSVSKVRLTQKSESVVIERLAPKSQNAMSFSDAISSAMKSEIEDKVARPEKKTKAAAPPEKSESLLEKARRMREEREAG
ncbi:MAG: hypothetical protein IBX56_19750 [Methylomicrobium sp.]|nr:hypothetical protein [Methylomicrobium sp.]